MTKVATSKDSAKFGNQNIPPISRTIQESFCPILGKSIYGFITGIGQLFYIIMEMINIRRTNLFQVQI